MTFQTSLQPFFVAEIYVSQRRLKKYNCKLLYLKHFTPGNVPLSLLQIELKQIIRPVKNDNRTIREPEPLINETDVNL
jgi:hypothetical protein